MATGDLPCPVTGRAGGNSANRVDAAAQS